MARTTAAATGSKSGRRRTFLWIAVAAVIIVGLIWGEQVALLYVLATFSVTALLLVVAFSDLGGTRRQFAQTIPYDDSAAAGDGLDASAAVAARTAKGR